MEPVSRVGAARSGFCSSHMCIPSGPDPFAKWTPLYQILLMFGIVSLDLRRVSVCLQCEGITDSYVRDTRPELGVTDAT